MSKIGQQLIEALREAADSLEAEAKQAAEIARLREENAKQCCLIQSQADTITNLTMRLNGLGTSDMTEQAAEIKRLKAELEDAFDRIDRLRKELDDEEAESHDSIRSRDTVIDRQERDIRRLENELAKTRATATVWRKANEEQLRQNDRLKKKLADEDTASLDTIRHLNTEIEKRGHEIERLKARIREYDEAVAAHNAKMEATPTFKRPTSLPEGLRAVAEWLDVVFEDAGTGKDVTQQDLRRWADEYEAASREPVEAGVVQAMRANDLGIVEIFHDGSVAVCPHKHSSPGERYSGPSLADCISKLRERRKTDA